MNQSNIRNFCIIAHIDHGKSTLADRLLEATGTVAHRDMQEQLLDSNPIERERGITIKLAPVRMVYQLSVFGSRFSDPSLSVSQLTGQQTTGKLETENRQQKSDNWILNLIDTPGHVDFNYEVSRSLAACEGAILVVDATQGVQAQTLANLNLARRQKLAIIPVVNKIDLPNAQVEKSVEELCSLGFNQTDIITISAKLGTNIDRVLNAIVERIPPPKGIPTDTLRALVFSSQYDSHKGVVVYVRIVDGSIVTGPVARQPQNHPQGDPDFGAPRTRATRLHFLASRTEFTSIEIGYFTPQMKPAESLYCGEVGYIATGLKDVKMAKVGDTITNQLSVFSSQFSDSGLPVFGQSVIKSIKKTDEQKTEKPAADNRKQKTDNRILPLPGYHEPKPMVFLGLYPIQTEDINLVREALGKLRLSDSAFTFRPISSLALGHGFHCGFLGLLHAEVVQERLTREFNLNLLATAPTVEYRIRLKHEHVHQTTPPNPLFRRGGEGELQSTISIQSAAEFPDPSLIDQSFEPVMQVTIFSPKKYVGAVMQLAQDKRGEYIDLEYVADQAKFTYLVPLSEMIIDFFDRLKSITEGYASLDYEFFDYQPVELVKLDILLNHEKVDAFSQLVVRENAEYFGKRLVEKLKDVIPRHQFAVPIQATIGGNVIARSDVKPFRKDVIQKLYGGDRTRKDKLLEAQKKGKKKMKMVGRVEIPQEAFLKVFKR